MHSHMLAIVDVPAVQPNPEADQRIAESIAKLESEMDDSFASIIKKIRIQELRNMTSEFARLVLTQVEDRMAPYDQNSNNPVFLEFDNWTDELKADFEKSVDCIRRPDGKVVELGWYPYYKKFVIHNDRVVSRNAGPLKHKKLTRKSRKYQALPSYPRKKLYKDFKDYAEQGRGFSFNESQQAYGFFINPNAIWDWYDIGGRWPCTFLVKTDCVEYSVGEHEYENLDEAFPPPEGYRWVSAARKKDIQWDAMRKYITDCVTAQFHELERCFKAKEQPVYRYVKWQEDGLYTLAGCIYRKGQTLAEHLAENDLSADWKYPVSFADIVTANGWEGEHKEFRKRHSLDGVDEILRRITDETIDNCDDEAVLVSIDYHS